VEKFVITQALGKEMFLTYLWHIDNRYGRRAAEFYQKLFLRYADSNEKVAIYVDGQPTRFQQLSDQLMTKLQKGKWDGKGY